MAARHGKIARLPFQIREQLNTRINDGATAASLVPWLNSQPVVQAILDAQFGGVAISEQNISNWRAGGFLEWAGLQDWRAICTARAEDAAQIASSGMNAQRLLVLLNARIVATLDTYDETRPSHFPDLIAFQRLVATVNQVRRTEQRDERLAFDRERLEFDREARRSRQTAGPGGELKIESGKCEAVPAAPAAPQPQAAVPATQKAEPATPTPGASPTTPSQKPTAPPPQKPAAQPAGQPAPAPRVSSAPPSPQPVAPHAAIPVPRFHHLAPSPIHPKTPMLQAA